MIVSESRQRGKPSADDGGVIGGVSPAGFSNVAATFSQRRRHTGAYLTLA
ncbi:hypothetical protein STPA111741_13180 [Stenotrophomonas pavanii]|nr:hypothetical protein SAMN04487784_1810 [Stenotrophomonas pavanii]